MIITYPVQHFFFRSPSVMAVSRAPASLLMPLCLPAALGIMACETVKKGGEKSMVRHKVFEEVLCLCSSKGWIWGTLLLAYGHPAQPKATASHLPHSPRLRPCPDITQVGSVKSRRVRRGQVATRSTAPTLSLEGWGRGIIL